MIKRTILAMILSLSLINTVNVIPNALLINKVSESEDCGPNCGCKKEYDFKIITQNINLLTDSQKKCFETIQKDVSNGKTLTRDQEMKLFEIKNHIAKEKLGDDKYKEFMNLLKKHKDNKLTESDKQKLTEYFAKILS